MKPQFKLEEVYLDLSKLSEDKRKEVRRLLFKKPHYEKLFFLPDYEDKPFLICLYGKWDLEVNKRMEYTELTYSQFLDMMGESEEVLQVDIYSGELNTERISTYKKLSEQYNIEESTVRDIFNAGADWVINFKSNQ